MTNNVTVIINNRDLLTWPRRMCTELERMSGLHEIIIVDNGSTNRALLRWYKECPHKVVFLENLGHTAPWTAGVIATLDTDYYVVTDPDLDLAALPNDTLLYLQQLLHKRPELRKVGLSLQTDAVPEASPYHGYVSTYVARVQAGPFDADGLLLSAPIETTFAMYDRRILAEYQACGARTAPPYQAKHLPWDITKPDAEFAYYLRRASSAFSGYLEFTGLREAPELATLYHAHTHGKVSTKWESYFNIYERWLAPWREKRVSLLEIGVQNGGSLEMWSKYFPHGSQFIGCDANPAIQRLHYDDPRISLVIGPASDPAVFRSVLERCGSGFDVIIDDGSHLSLDTISNFVNYFPTLRPGGLYIIEDMHAAYWPEYQGGFFNQRSVASFFKSLFDLVNVEHCRGDFTPNQLFQTFFPLNALPPALADGSIYGISVYNSVYLIEKSAPWQKPVLGKEVVVGDVAAVDDRVLNPRRF